MCATGFFISYIPACLIKHEKFTGAGLLGSVLALALVPFLPEGALPYGAFLVLFTVFAVWVSDRVRFPGTHRHDDPRIVIDEIAGYWTACAFLPRSPVFLITAFILFRVFDTIKPFGIKKIDAMPGGVGVVLDDTASGIIANLLTRPLAVILCSVGIF